MPGSGEGGGRLGGVLVYPAQGVLKGTLQSLNLLIGQTETQPREQVIEGLGLEGAVLAGLDFLAGEGERLSVGNTAVTLGGGGEVLDRGD